MSLVHELKRPRPLGQVASAIWGAERWVVPLAVGLSFLCGGCSSSTPSPQASQGSAELLEPVVRRLEPGALGGAEVCFNGSDDNDNRLIDEGCGVAQSEVQFVLAWDQQLADLDLYVTDPEGEVAAADSTTHLGLTLSADCPKEKKACHGQNYENAYIEEPDLAGGEYVVRVRLESLPPEESRVLATLGVRLPSGTMTHEMEFFHEGQEVVLSFDVEAPERKEDQEKQD